MRDVTEAMLRAPAAASVARATVTEVRTDVLLVHSAAREGVRACLILQTSDRPVAYREGEDVLVWLPGSVDEDGIVLGRVATPQDVAAPPSPAELVIEAHERLTLRCGAASITMREDGRMLLKGSDIVTHAQRLNRIRGGSVAIN
jgi:hypothetical protein